MSMCRPGFPALRPSVVYRELTGAPRARPPLVRWARGGTTGQLGAAVFGLAPLLRSHGQSAARAVVVPGDGAQLCSDLVAGKDIEQSAHLRGLQ